MLNSHKNTLLEVVTNAGFRADQFTAKDENIQLVEGGHILNAFILTFKGSKLRFIVRTSPTDFNAFDFCWTLFAPKWPMSDIYPDPGYSSIELVSHHLHSWLSEVVVAHLKEATVPNLWEEAQAQSELFAAPFEESGKTDHYTAAEKALLRAAIEQVRQSVTATFNPTVSELEAINERLDYLSKALDRLSRFDWRGILIATMFGIVTSLTLDTARGAQLYQIFKEAFTLSLHLLR